jgi:hypothetical protein
MLNVIKQTRVMETESISKNEVSPKDLITSRRNLKLFAFFVLMAGAFAFSSCGKDDDENSKSSSASDTECNLHRR